MSTPPVDGQAWLRFNHLLRSALPIRSLSHLLAELAEAWRDLTEAEVVCVGVLQPQSKTLIGACARTKSPTIHYKKSVPTDAPWNVSLVIPERTDFRDFSPARHGKIESIPFRQGDQTIGGAVLAPQPAFPLVRSVIGELEELSGRLCLQAIACPETSPATYSAALSTEGPLRRAKLDALAAFSAGAGHEINNPLATIAGRVQLLLRDEHDPHRRQALTTIGGQAYRVRDMIGDLMQFSRPPCPSPENLNLTDVCRRVVKSLDDEASARGCRIEMRGEPHVPIRADRQQLCVVVSCLLKNGIESVRQGGPIRIECRSASHCDRHLAVFTVTDCARTLSEEEREHLFDPFYSGRQAGRGLGFGLPKCFRIVCNHGGWIDVESDSQPTQHTSFQVYWPSSASESCDASA